MTVKYDSDLVGATQEQREQEGDQSHHQNLIGVFWGKRSVIGFMCTEKENPFKTRFLLLSVAKLSASFLNLQHTSVSTETPGHRATAVK